MISYLALVALAQTSQPVDCAARIARYSEWREAPGQAWDFAWPDESGAELSIIGVEHVRNPEHPQFARIAAALAEPGRRVVFYEGPDRGVAGDLGATVRQLGESGAVPWPGPSALRRARWSPIRPSRRAVCWRAFPPIR